jgi:hypothetical protein
VPNISISKIKGLSELEIEELNKLTKEKVPTN